MKNGGVANLGEMVQWANWEKREVGEKRGREIDGESSGVLGRQPSPFWEEMIGFWKRISVKDEKEVRWPREKEINFSYFFFRLSVKMTLDWCLGGKKSTYNSSNNLTLWFVIPSLKFVMWGINKTFYKLSVFKVKMWVDDIVWKTLKVGDTNYG